MFREAGLLRLSRGGPVCRSNYPTGATMPKRRVGDTIVGRVRPADPFELIRWLARSQSDPRKAIAELVQNSLDAGARMVRITRFRERGVASISILDDGEGVIPELSRVEALTYIATHIGYSRKRNLTPEERRELMTQGKYGIGLLGVLGDWAYARDALVSSERTRVPASAFGRRAALRDRPDAHSARPRRP